MSSEAGPPLSGLFGFVQWDLAGQAVPAEGRHVVRRYAGDAAQHVLVFTGTRAPRRPRGRRARPAEEDAAPVDVTRVSVIGAEPLADAEGWLAQAGEETVANALPVLEAALHAHRDRDRRPAPRRARAAPPARVRVGYGTGEEVADGRWTEARELRPPREKVKREAALRPQERFAALLAARDVALACELLALRARLDLDQRRGREAALQLDAALVRRARGARGLARARRDAGAPGRAARARAASRRPPRRARGRAGSTRPPPRRSRACSAASRPRCGRAPPAPRSERARPRLLGREGTRTGVISARTGRMFDQPSR